MNNSSTSRLAPYHHSLPGRLLAAREAVMGPLRPVLREYDVTEQQWRVLRILDADGPIDMQSIAAAALLLAPSVTRILRGMSERGLIERRIDSVDARRSIVTISAAGRDLVSAVTTRALEILDHYRAAFGPERLERLIEELDAFTASLAECAIKLP